MDSVCEGKVDCWRVLMKNPDTEQCLLSWKITSVMNWTIKRRDFSGDLWQGWYLCCKGKFTDGNGFTEITGENFQPQLEVESTFSTFSSISATFPLEIMKIPKVLWRYWLKLWFSTFPLHWLPNLESFYLMFIHNPSAETWNFYSQLATRLHYDIFCLQPSSFSSKISPI